MVKVKKQNIDGVNTSVEENITDIKEFLEVEKNKQDF